MYRAYETELFRFDQLYRHFCEAADQAEAPGWDILKPLRADMEACYVNWYLPKLALAWGKFVEPQGRPACWRSGRSSGSRTSTSSTTATSGPGWTRPTTAGPSSSSAMPSATRRPRNSPQELNGKYRFEATLTSQLGVLPSYTALGMASLLPHKTLAYKPDGDVLVDGKPTSSTERAGRDPARPSAGWPARRAN